MKKKYEAQILVVVIMVLLLLSIIIIGIVAVVTRDAEQSIGSREYETSYNKTEEQMIKILDKYSKVSVKLSEIVNDSNLSCTGTMANGYKCSFQDGNMFTQVSVADKNEVEDFELGKDETFKINLNSSYSDDVTITWTGKVAMYFTYEYQNGGTYGAIKDVYDNSKILTQSGTTAEHHPLSIQAPNPDENKVIINIGSITAQGGTPLFLKIKPIMKEGITTSISIYGENSSFPNQIRQIEGVSYYEGENTPSSAPTLITQIPLAGSEPEILNYVLRSEAEVNKDPNAYSNIDR